MKTMLFITNYPSPYRVDFWNLLGKEVELTVSFTSSPEEQTHRSSKWFNSNYEHFNAVFLRKGKKIGHHKVFTDIIPLIKKGYDHIICGGYASPTSMLAIEYMKLHGIPFCLEADGGLIQDDVWYKRAVKKYFISAASCWFSSGKTTTEYFLYYGAKKDKIIEYPFTSMWKADLENARKRILSDKQLRKQQLNISEEKVIITVGQFIYRKGFDILLKAMNTIPKDVGVYFIGGIPSEEYLAIQKQNNLDNAHFVGFKSKDELDEYYRAADLFVLPTREDIWGLVINEAMAYGLPVVASDKCGAALTLIEDGVNGYIVPVDNATALADGINRILQNNNLLGHMSERSLKTIQGYTIEQMVKVHLNYFLQ